jgi:ribosome-associated heat shock protein Hsp15
MADDACRVDVWLWRARFCKTRTVASRLVETGQVRLTRSGQQSRLDKPSRTVRPGDELVFASGGRLTAIRVEALGLRRGPPEEARGLYAPLDASMDDQDGGGPGGDRPLPPLTTRAPG